VIAFVCECADDNCRRSVLLSPAAFIPGEEHGEVILKPGHEALADGPMRAEWKATSRTFGSPDLGREGGHGPQLRHPAARTR
jgi:hypothetical protein